MSSEADHMPVVLAMTPGLLMCVGRVWGFNGFLFTDEGERRATSGVGDELAWCSTRSEAIDGVDVRTVPDGNIAAILQRRPA